MRLGDNVAGGLGGPGERRLAVLAEIGIVAAAQGREFFGVAEESVTRSKLRLVSDGF